MGANSFKDGEQAKSEHSALNEKEIDLIKECWESVKSTEDLGIAIMIRIFLEHKEIKNKWIFASNLETEEEMLENSQIRYHAKKVIEVLSRIIIQIIESSRAEKNKNESVAYDLFKLGKSHHHYGVERAHFAHFEESFLYCLKKQSTLDTYNSRTEKAWRKVFVMISSKMSDGIEAEAAESSSGKADRRIF